MNWFIEDEVRDKAVTKTLLLTFEAIEDIDIYDRDLISYYCSQLQFIFPEYHVKGNLLPLGSEPVRKRGEALPI